LNHSPATGTARSIGRGEHISTRTFANPRQRSSRFPFDRRILPVRASSENARFRARFWREPKRPGVSTRSSMERGPPHEHLLRVFFQSAGFFRRYRRHTTRDDWLAAVRRGQSPGEGVDGSVGSAEGHAGAHLRAHGREIPAGPPASSHLAFPRRRESARGRDPPGGSAAPPSPARPCIAKAPMPAQRALFFCSQRGRRSKASQGHDRDFEDRRPSGLAARPTGSPRVTRGETRAGGSTGRAASFWFRSQRG